MSQASQIIIGIVGVMTAITIGYFTIAATRDLWPFGPSAAEPRAFASTPTPTPVTPPDTPSQTPESRPTPDQSGTISFGERVDGKIDKSFAIDIYTIQVGADNQIAFFDELSPTCSDRNIGGDILWELEHESGKTIVGWEDVLSDCTLQPRRVSLDAGAWTITVFGDGTATGDYSFQIWSVPLPRNMPDIAIGETVQGEIEIVGAKNIYNFQVDADLIVDFEELFPDTCDNLDGDILWEIKIGSETPFNGWDNDIGSCTEQNKNVPLTRGTWTIEVFGEQAATGSYRFKITKLN